MRQKHVYYETAKNRLTQRLWRILNSYRLHNITMQTALTQSEQQFHKTLEEIQSYTTRILGKRDLGKNMKPLTKQDLTNLQTEITRKQSDFKRLLQTVHNR